MYMSYLAAQPDLSHIEWILPNAYVYSIFPSPSQCRSICVSSLSQILIRPRRMIQISISPVPIPAWFDMYTLDFTSPPQDEEGMMESVAELHDMIISERPPEGGPGRVVIGGFSQGATLSLLAGVTQDFEEPLGGVAVFGGRLALPWKIKEVWLPLVLHSRRLFLRGYQLQKPNSRLTPIFWGHGTMDATVQIETAQKSVKIPTDELGYSLSNDGEWESGLTYKPYKNLTHTIGPQALEDFRRWLSEVVPKLP
jgi:predicted esterase